MKTVLITGASSGIGKACALLFARKGFKVIATMRDLNKSHLLQTQAHQENLKIDIRAIDVTDEHLVATAIKQILADYQRIDILINNAGAGFLGTLEQTSLTNAQAVMDINFFGVWRITQAVLPSMRQQRVGHIISVTSVGGILGQPFNEAYCAAKFAVEGLMESLAPTVKRFGIQISLVEPGPVNSDFVTSTLKNSAELPSYLEKDYKSMLDAYSEATQQAFAKWAQNPDEIAHSILNIARVEEPHFRYQTSEMSQKIANLKLTDSTGNQVIALSGSRLPDKI